MNEESISILLVDDDERLLKRLGRAMEDRGLTVMMARNYEEALLLAEDNSPELAVVDLRLPGKNGLELTEALLGIDPSTRVVILTGYGSIATAVDATRRGVVDYLQKPADAEQILQVFENEGSTGNYESDDFQVPSLARLEWEHIQRVLNDCEGNISKAARVLGIHRRSLQRKLAKYPAKR